jgi:transposase
MTYPDPDDLPNALNEGDLHHSQSAMPARQRDTGPAEAATLLQPTRPRARETPDTADTATADRNVVQLAVKMTGDVRRRVVRARYGRRGRSGDPEYGIKGLLVRNLEHLRPAQFAKVMGTLAGDRRGQEILAAWIAKEKLRDVLNLRARVTGSTPCERDVRDRLFRFYDWCAAHDDIPELASLARTISRWEDELVAATLTGVTNARSESLNRIAKLEARNAYSFPNPANQRRRVRMACTRGTRRSRQVTRRRSLLVTSRKHDPG